MFKASYQALYSYFGDSSQMANEFIPEDRPRLVEGRVVRDNLRADIARARLYAGTDDPKKIASVKDKFKRILEKTRDDSLYACTGLKISSIREADRRDLTVALVNMYYRIQEHGHDYPDQIMLML